MGGTPSLTHQDAGEAFLHSGTKLLLNIEITFLASYSKKKLLIMLSFYQELIHTLKIPCEASPDLVPSLGFFFI